MYCTKCGEEINDEAVICPKCGCPTLNYATATAETEKTATNGFAIAGFICSFISPILGWIFGGMGLSKANKTNGKGKGLSVAAIIISSVSFLISFIYYIDLFSYLFSYYL